MWRPLHLILATAALWLVAGVASGRSGPGQNIAPGVFETGFSKSVRANAPQTVDRPLGYRPCGYGTAPGVRLFLTRDPAGFVDGPNLYAYVRNNPLTSFDPHGLFDPLTVARDLSQGKLGRALLEVAGSPVPWAPGLVSGTEQTRKTRAVYKTFRETGDGKGSSAAHAVAFAAMETTGATQFEEGRRGEQFEVNPDGVITVREATQVERMMNISFGLLQMGGTSLGLSQVPKGMGGATAQDVVKMVNPAQLRWTQTTAGGRGRAAEIRASMAEHGWKGDPIDVVQTADGLTTVDHTRAAVALEMKMKEIPVRVHQADAPLPESMLSRPWNRDGDTAKTWGEAVRLRGQGQTPPLGSTGSPKPPRLPKD